MRSMDYSNWSVCPSDYISPAFLAVQAVIGRDISGFRMTRTIKAAIPKSSDCIRMIWRENRRKSQRQSHYNYTCLELPHLPRTAVDRWTESAYTNTKTCIAEYIHTIQRERERESIVILV